MIQKSIILIKEVLNGKAVSLIVFFVIVACAVSAGFFYIAGENFSEYIDNRFAAAIPPNTVKVSPRSTGGSFLSVGSSRSAKPLNEAALTRIRNMQGVKIVHPVMATSIPMQARISMFGFSYRTDLLCLGVPYDFIKDNIPGQRNRQRWTKPNFDLEIPVLVPETILNAYNDGIAPANNLPRLSKTAVNGLRFNLLFGHSSLRQIENSESLDGVVIGVTNKLDALGLIIPLSVVRHYNRKFGYSSDYVFAFVETRDHASFAEVVKQIDAMGFITETEKTLSDHILTLKKNTRLLIDGLMYLVIFISVVAIAFSTMIAVINRVEYYRIMRMVGASKVFISFTVLVKYLILGLISAYCALAIIKFSSGMVNTLPVIAGLKIDFSLPQDFSSRMMWACSIIPVLSCIPALIKLYVKALNVD